MPRDPLMRASDADRDRVAADLREHAAAGRLTMAEFDERLDAALAARTYGELDALVADLPQLNDGLPVPAEERHGPEQLPPVLLARRRRHRGWSYLSVCGVCWGVWAAQAATGQGLHDLWPVWVTLPWGAAMLPGRLRSYRYRRDRR